jgi:hypothetical protein
VDQQRPDLFDLEGREGRDLALAIDPHELAARQGGRDDVAPRELDHRADDDAVELGDLLDHEARRVFLGLALALALALALLAARPLALAGHDPLDGRGVGRADERPRLGRQARERGGARNLAAGR